MRYKDALDALMALNKDEPDKEKVRAWNTAAHNLANAAREDERLTFSPWPISYKELLETYQALSRGRKEPRKLFVCRELFLFMESLRSGKAWPLPLQFLGAKVILDPEEPRFRFEDIREMEAA